MQGKTRRILSLVLSFGLLFQQIGFAQVATKLNLGSYLARIGNNIIQDRFRPLHLRYFSYDSLNDNFKILLDKGDLNNLKPPELENSTKTLLSYFLVGVTLPDEMFWVNLRPDSEGQIIDPWLEKTDVGKIMLEADLQLKKDTAAMTSPATPEGKEYWDKLYKKAEEFYGYDAVTIPTLTRPWLVPGEIIIRESKDSAYVYKATLKVMLEQDYLKDSSTYNFKDERSKALNEYSSQLIRELIIPKLTKEVNSSKRYAALRQVYYSLILSRWFKLRFTGKTGIYASLINTKNLTNLTSQEPWTKTTYFKQYQKSFQDGEYNIKEPVYTPTGQVIRSYFSGGINVGSSAINTQNGIILPSDNVHKLGNVVGAKAVVDPRSINLQPNIVVSPVQASGDMSASLPIDRSEMPEEGIYSRRDFLKTMKTAGVATLGLSLFGLMRSTKADSADFSATRDRAEKLLKSGKFKEAIVEFQKAINIYPDGDAAVYSNLGFALSQLGKYEEAILVYRKGISIFPHYADTYNNLGLALWKLGRHREAIATFEEVLSKYYGYALARYNLGTILIEIGEYREAISNLRIATDNNPKFVSAYENLGIAYAKILDRGHAIAAFKEAININPDYAGAYFNLGLLYLQSPDLKDSKKEAAKYLKKAISLQPDILNRIPSEIREEVKILIDSSSSPINNSNQESASSAVGGQALSSKELFVLASLLQLDDYEPRAGSYGLIDRNSPEQAGSPISSFTSPADWDRWDRYGQEADWVLRRFYNHPLVGDFRDKDAVFLILQQYLRSNWNLTQLIHAVNTNIGKEYKDKFSILAIAFKEAMMMNYAMREEQFSALYSLLAEFHKAYLIGQIFRYNPDAFASEIGISPREIQNILNEAGSSWSREGYSDISREQIGQFMRVVYLIRNNFLSALQQNYLQRAKITFGTLVYQGSSIQADPFSGYYTGSTDNFSGAPSFDPIFGIIIQAAHLLKRKDVLDLVIARLNQIKEELSEELNKNFRPLYDERSAIQKELSELRISTKEVFKSWFRLGNNKYRGSVGQYKLLKLRLESVEREIEHQKDLRDADRRREKAQETRRLISKQIKEIEKYKYDIDSKASYVSLPNNTPSETLSGSPLEQENKQDGSVDKESSSSDTFFFPGEHPVGGIDFRSLPITIQPMGSFSGLNFSLPQLSQAELRQINIDSEIQEIKNMVHSGITPSGQRIKELIAACVQKKEINSQVDSLLLCLADIFRLEEENASESSPELREALVIVDSLS